MSNILTLWECFCVTASEARTCEITPISLAKRSPVTDDSASGSYKWHQDQTSSASAEISCSCRNNGKGLQCLVPFLGNQGYSCNREIPLLREQCCARMLTLWECSYLLCHSDQMPAQKLWIVTITQHKGDLLCPFSQYVKQLLDVFRVCMWSLHILTQIEVTSQTTWRETPDNNALEDV